MGHLITREKQGAISRSGVLAHVTRDAQASQSERTRVLVVDDNSDVLDVISKLLSESGYDVVSGGNGMEGLERFREKPCKLVLTDLDMPAMDGVALARRIKSESPLIPVVLMTGNALGEKEVSQDTREHFIDEILYKPIRFRDLYATFQRLLR